MSKYLLLIAILSNLVAAAVMLDHIAARAATSTIKSSTSIKASTVPASAGSLLGVNIGGSSSPLLGVNLGSSTLIAINLSTPKSTPKSSPTMMATSTVSSLKAPSASLQSSKLSTMSSVVRLSTITTMSSRSMTSYPTALPSTFSAPVQGQGILSLNNLPAMPPVIDSTFAFVLGTAYALMSGTCNAQYQCTITVAGSIQNLLVDGNNYATQSSVAAWCDGGRCYGSADVPVTATAPFIITCDQLTNTQACSATISGAATAIFQNGRQVELWGWITPAGYCQNGVCTASIKAIGDPMY
ncbi:hypothetical protein ACN47E_006093 [Coniothyrium glycines]